MHFVTKAISIIIINVESLCKFTENNYNLFKWSYKVHSCEYPWGWTHRHTDTHTHTHVPWTKEISRNQLCFGQRSVHTWFKTVYQYSVFVA